ncbi:MAG: carboxymuconolactone decarboxylase family protein [Mesorhizobium sp.]
MRTRREVLGDDYVDRAIANADDFSQPLQEIVTEFCWDRIWNRPGLPRKVRSLLNIAMISVLNRPHELRIHIAGALRNGCTHEEIREALLQVTIYAGVPAGVDGFRIAREVLKKDPQA